MTADHRTPEELRALMEQPGPAVPPTLQRALEELDEWKRKTAAWQSVCDRQNARIAALEAERDRLRKAMPSPDLLFNAAYLLRGTWDHTCIAVAPSLEAAAAGILELAADDDDEKVDALVELVRRS